MSAERRPILSRPHRQFLAKPLLPKRFMPWMLAKVRRNVHFRAGRWERAGRFAAAGGESRQVMKREIQQISNKPRPAAISVSPDVRIG
jgi:hypothetical protein